MKQLRGFAVVMPVSLLLGICLLAPPSYAESTKTSKATKATPKATTTKKPDFGGGRRGETVAAGDNPETNPGNTNTRYGDTSCSAPLG